MELKSVLLEMFVQYLLPVLATGLAALLGLALKSLRDMLSARASESKLHTVSARVAHFVSVVVADIEKTVKPELEAASKDGVITAEEGAKLKALALERVKKLLAEHGMKELQGVLGIVAPQVEVYLSGLIEKAVSQLPRPQTALAE